MHGKIGKGPNSVSKLENVLGEFCGEFRKYGTFSVGVHFEEKQSRQRSEEQMDVIALLFSEEGQSLQFTLGENRFAGKPEEAAAYIREVMAFADVPLVVETTKDAFYVRPHGDTTLSLNLPRAGGANPQTIDIESSDSPKELWSKVLRILEVASSGRYNSEWILAVQDGDFLRAFQAVGKLPAESYGGSLGFHIVSIDGLESLRPFLPKKPGEEVQVNVCSFAMPESGVEDARIDVICKREGYQLLLTIDEQAAVSRLNATFRTRFEVLDE